MDTRNYSELARYPTSFEASLARNHLEANGIPTFLGGEAFASWFWQYGPEIGGVRLLVQRQHLEESKLLLSELREEYECSAAEENAAMDMDRTEPADLPPELLRAWRAAIIGLVYFPVLLHVYSTWLFAKHEFFLDSGDQVDWRVPVAMIINIGVFCSVAMLIFDFVRW